jgi:hypothetical protein
MHFQVGLVSALHWEARLPQISTMQASCQVSVNIELNLTHMPGTLLAKDYLRKEKKNFSIRKKIKN